MEFTNDFKDLTDADADLVLRGQREVLLAAVQRNIFCQVSGVVLDIRTAVLVLPSKGPAAVMTAEVWDAAQERVAAGVEAAGIKMEVYDGRELNA